VYSLLQATEVTDLPEPPPKKGYKGANYNTVIATLVPTHFEPKAVRLRNKQRTVPKAEEELEQEIEAAKLLAAKSRSEQGAYNGVLEASDFTLPNPGGGAPLLEKAALCLVRGHRYGLIGRNGKGKSTLLKAMAARRVGNIPPNVTVHYVTQDVELTDITRELTPVQCVLAADIERDMLVKELAKLEAAATAENLDSDGQQRHVHVIEQLQLINADSAERRAVDLLKNLGFSDELRARPLKELSGGWRVRTMLAAAIFAKPDMLLLDEPTNHLSILAVMWLARELATSETWQNRIIIVVSHDRYFIDEVCGDTLHISGVSRRLTQAHGSYSTWAARRKDQQLVFARESALRVLEIAKLKEYAGHGFKYGGASSQISKMKEKARKAERLEDEAVEVTEEWGALREDVELPLNLASGGELEGFLIQMIGVSFGYPGHPELFAGADFGITTKSRIVLLGENGNGKTTLVRLLLGDLTPTAGEIRTSGRVRVALVNQHHADQIDMDLSPLEYMLSIFPGDGTYENKMRLRGHLASCGVTGSDPDLQNVLSGSLSGGQRSRVALAAVSYRKPHVLILDEPVIYLCSAVYVLFCFVFVFVLYFFGFAFSFCDIYVIFFSRRIILIWNQWPRLLSP
jgi:ATP-binding cassette subfamily F protein 3